MKKLLAFSSSLSIFFNIFTPVQLYVSGGKTLITLVATLLLFFYNLRWLSNSVLKFLIYLLIVGFMIITGNQYFENYIPNIVYMAFGLFAFEYFFHSNDIFFAKSILYTLYVSLFILVVISIPQFYLTPNLTRLVNRMEENQITDTIYFWTISYETVHNICVYSIPLFAMYHFSKGVTKVLSLIYISLLFVVMIFADATTPLILMSASLLLFVIYVPTAKTSTNISKLLLFSVFGLVICDKEVLTSTLTSIQPIFEGSSTYKKIDEIIYAMSSGNTSGDLQMREEVYNITLNSLKNNLLLPEYNITKIGLHMVLIDHFVALGLFLFIPFVVFICDRYKRCIAQIDGSYRMYYYMCVGLFLFMGCTKNFFLYCPTFCYVPIALILIRNKYIYK